MNGARNLFSVHPHHANTLRRSATLCHSLLRVESICRENDRAALPAIPGLRSGFRHRENCRVNRLVELNLLYRYAQLELTEI